MFARYLFAILVVVGLGSATAAAATPSDDTMINAIQAPAWLVRGTERLPLRVGAVLNDGDVVRTGSRGRVEILLPEGSLVKLGENAEFEAERLLLTRDAEGGIFNGVLNVLRGAFRFTTRLTAKSQRRSVDIRVGVLTAGIRGTDIWGKATGDKDFIVLIEGQIAMSSPDHPEPLMMTQALDAMEVPVGGVMQAMQGVDMPMVQALAVETEMAEDNGMMMMSGKLQLVVMSSRDERYSVDQAARLAEAGYPATVEAIDLGSDRGRWYRVVISNLASIYDARMLGDSLIGTANVKDYWIRNR